MSAQGSPWVFARSVLPDALCKADLAELGNQPLGKILFNDSRFVRQPFQITKIEPLSALQQMFNNTQSLWARRSVFTYKQFNMMVAEVFLPASPAYKTLNKDM